MEGGTTARRAARDDRLEARVVRAVPLRYAAGADPATDRPAHVRAGSGLARVGGRIAVIQDDAHFVALADPATGLADAVALPAGEGGLRQFDDARGNKRFKLDLEACATVPSPGGPLLLALGSGSSPLREKVLVARGLDTASPEVRLVEAAALYATLRAARAFSGSEMNVEGAVVLGGRVRLFNRGNGAPAGGHAPVDATCDLPLDALLAYLDDPAGRSPPSPSDVAAWTLGEVDGHALGFTDGAALDGRLFFTATAEDSPDAVRDGPVAGSAIGVFDADGRGARWALLRDAHGGTFDGKVEGLLLRGPTSAWIVVDRDDPSHPSELCEVVLDGPWIS
ncbi:MAG TPA: hypothetical protein VHG91_09835 [Longimicrobium sp.]|nr:hypothetical protein [Longimicrobium sp.]